ncbi:Uncharacterized protein APZ42_018825 [Daphnia magna]|uniref:Uncharacterized protein n=1 Tax=Daphnia magna TaxID=35525 RepID=A0A0P4ZAA0_9CRUS|nr:Uncharacterized protein APZ42_018825 [Daphnia magna]
MTSLLLHTWSTFRYCRIPRQGCPARAFITRFESISCLDIRKYRTSVILYLCLRIKISSERRLFRYDVLDLLIYKKHNIQTARTVGWIPL